MASTSDFDSDSLGSNPNVPTLEDSELSVAEQWKLYNEFNKKFTVPKELLKQISEYLTKQYEEKADKTALHLNSAVKVILSEKHNLYAANVLSEYYMMSPDGMNRIQEIIKRTKGPEQ